MRPPDLCSVAVFKTRDSKPRRILELPGCFGMLTRMLSFADLLKRSPCQACWRLLLARLPPDMQVRHPPPPPCPFFSNFQPFNGLLWLLFLPEVLAGTPRVNPFPPQMPLVDCVGWKVWKRSRSKRQDFSQVRTRKRSSFYNF